MKRPDMEAAVKIVNALLSPKNVDHAIAKLQSIGLIDTLEEKTCPKDKCLSWEWCGGYVDEDCIRKSSGEDNFTPKK